MDCEKFDRIVLDLLYDELDELTSAAAKRHIEHCSRCRNIIVGLRATREVGVLPLVEPSEDLEPRILEAERRASAVLPLRKRIGRAVSIMASYAMRPQLAMALLLLLMLGGSLLFLRAHPGERENVQVTERGVPQGEGQSVAVVPVPGQHAANKPSNALKPEGHLARHAHVESETARVAQHSRQSEASAPAAGPAALASAAAPNATAGDGGTDDFAAATAAFRAGRYAEAERRFSAIANAGGSQAGSAALMAAEATRNSAGCRAAAPRFDDVSTRYAGSAVANQATWEAADCFRALGEIRRARRHYQALADVEGYSERAHRALDSLDQQNSAVATRAAAKPAPAHAAKKATVKQPTR